MQSSSRKFIKALESEGELVRITAHVDPCFEIAEITDRISKQPGGGKALLFENTGTGFPVLTNMMGSDRRIAMALGVGSLDEIPARIEGLFGAALSPKESFGDKLRMLPLLAGMSKWLPKNVRGRGECQQVIHEGDKADLGVLPVLKCWPHDGGRFVTLPLVHTVNPVTGARNVGMYRMQVTGERTTGMHWHIHKTGERHYRVYKKAGGRMPVSVCLGGDPVYTYCATAPMPDNIDEYLLAGFLRNRPVRLVKCLTNDLYVPSDCDIVIEGYVDPQEEKFVEGPFGDHTGFYSLEDLYPSFHVTAVTHRRDAVYPATLVGVPPQEDAYIAKATEKIFLAPIRFALQPEIEDLYMPAAGVAHNLGIVAIEKTYPGQAFKTAASMWGAGQMMFNKALIMVPAGTDVRNAGALARLVRQTDVDTDVMFSKGVYDVLDHSTAVTGTGGKIALDLTGKSAEHTGGGKKIPEGPVMAGGIESASHEYASEWAVVILYADPEADPDIKAFLATNHYHDIRFFVIVDTAACDLSAVELLWFCAGNTEPGRDITIHSGSLVIDARTKSPHRTGYPERVPNVVVSDPGTIELVDKRWNEYGLGDFVTSPSLRYTGLTKNDSAVYCQNK